MSEESANTSQEASKEEASKPAAPAAPAAKPEPPPPEPGEFGIQLQKACIAVQHLGKDAMGIEGIALTTADLIKGAAFLRDQCEFDLLVCCSGIDNKTGRQSVYHLYSLSSNKTLAVKVDAETLADGTDHSPSLCAIWPAADWHERESYDLLGIHYDGHPNLQRILMPIDWIGHPLRKDYKVEDPRLVWNER